jgi:hypothetical protein
MAATLTKTNNVINLTFDTLSTTTIYKYSCVNEIYELEGSTFFNDFEYILEDNVAYKIICVVPLAPPTSTQIFYIYNNQKLLEDIIRITNKTLCGCNCGSFKSIDPLESMVKLDLFLNQAQITQEDCSICNTSEFASCLNTAQLLTGSADLKNLAKKLIALKYLKVYKYELVYAADEQQVKDLFKYDTIIKCIMKLNINLNCI